MGSSERLQEVRQDTPQAGEFLRRALHLHLASPQVEWEEFQSWPTEAIETLARAWASWSSGLNEPLQGTDIQEEFAQRFDAYAIRERERLREMIERLKSPPFHLAVAGLDSNLAAIRALQREKETLLARSMVSPGWESLRSTLSFTVANAGLIAGMQDLVAARAAALQGAEISRWSKSLAEAAEHQARLSASIRLRGFDAPGAFGFAARLQEMLLASRNLLEEWAAPRAPALPSGWLREAPTIELYSASRTAAAIVESRDPEPSPAAVRLDEFTKDLEQRLTELNRELVVMYRGAQVALELTHDDHQRHFAISARELLSHVVHLLAPDKLLMAWREPAQGELDDKGRPTRRFRLRYIMRGTESSSYAAFAEQDVRQVLDLIEYLQRPTHGLERRLDPAAMRLLLKRIEGAIALLLEAAVLTRQASGGATD